MECVVNSMASMQWQLSLCLQQPAKYCEKVHGYTSGGVSKYRCIQQEGTLRFAAFRKTSVLNPLNVEVH